MSYDLEVWSVSKPSDGAFSASDGWTETNGGWCLRSSKWQLVADSPALVEPEDMSDQVARALPGIAFLTRLYLEGTYPAKALTKTKSVAKAIAKEAIGVLVDPQEDTIATPAGVKRIAPVKRGERFTSLIMSWWFLDDSPMVLPEGRERFLALIERLLPELLPKRYGTYEPLQFKYSETGRVHFLDFLTNEKRTIWAPSRPFDVQLLFPTPVGGSRGGFRFNYLSVEVDLALVTQTGWQEQLRRLWFEASIVVKPVYGDIRTLKGQPRNGWFSANDSECQAHPVRSWFWRGVPTPLGCAVVLGETYQELWPEFTRLSRRHAGLAFLSTENWPDEQDISQIVGLAPKDIVCPVVDMRLGTMQCPDKLSDYAPVWPFGEPFVAHR